MQKNNSTLMLLWSLAGASLAAGILLTIGSIRTLPRTLELWDRKAADIQALAAMQELADQNRRILAEYASYPPAPPSLETLTHTIMPGRSLTVRVTELLPCVPGWTFRKAGVEFNDIAGEDLGKWLQAGAAARPPWAVVECTLTAAPVAGRLSKAALVMETVERPSPGP